MKSIYQLYGDKLDDFWHKNVNILRYSVLVEIILHGILYPVSPLEAASAWTQG